MKRTSLFFILIFIFNILITPLCTKYGIVFANNEETRLHTFNVFGKYGIYSTDGTIILKPQFDLIRGFFEGLAVVRLGGKLSKKGCDFVDASFGFIDEKGKLVIPTIYEQADSFSEELASVKIKGGKWGYIDRSGNMIIQPIYEDANPFSEGLAQVKFSNSEGEYGYIDRTGKRVIKSNFEYYDESGCRGNNQVSFHDGLAAVKDSKTKKYGFIDKNGTFIISPKFDYAYGFKDGRAEVSVGGMFNPRFGHFSGSKYGFINKKGEFVIQPQFASLGAFSEGLAEVNINRKRGFIDYSGNIVIQPQFEGASRFSEGLAAVCLHNKWGYIDKTGKMIIKPKFQEANGFFEGLTVVKLPDEKTKTGEIIPGKVGFIDKTGTFKIPPKYEQAHFFQNGLASVGIRVKNDTAKNSYETLEGYIDKTGTFLIKPEFVNTSFYYGPYSRATKVYRKDRTGEVLASEEGLIDKSGHFVYSEKRDTGKQDPWAKGYVMVNMSKDSGPAKPRIVIKKFKKGTVDNTYPQFEGMPDIALQKQLNQKMLSLYTMDASDSSTDYSGDFTLHWNRNSIVSLLITSFFYAHGAAHGYPSHQSYTLNVETGKIINLSDLFKSNTPWLNKLDDLARKEVKKKIRDQELSSDKPFEGIHGSEEFYLSDESNSLVLLYMGYEMGELPYSLVTIDINLNDLKDVLRPQFYSQTTPAQGNAMPTPEQQTSLQALAGADKELNETYKTLMSSLNPEQKSILKKDEIDWIKQRESACKDLTDETLRLNCHSEKTKERIKILQAWPRDK